MTPDLPSAQSEPHDPLTCELCHAEGVTAEIAALRESLRWAMQWVPMPKTQHNIYATNFAKAMKVLEDA